MKSSTKMPAYTGFSAGGDPKVSMGASAGITYSSIANIPKAKKTKLIQEAKPMVWIYSKNTINLKWNGC